MKSAGAGNPKALSSVRKRLLFIVGSLSAGVGIIGIFVPLLPTTPFLLLSAACYTRSSERFYNKLTSSRWLGAYISNYRENTGIPVKTKIAALSTLWLTMGISAAFATGSSLVRAILVIIAAAVTLHILSLKTKTG